MSHYVTVIDTDRTENNPKVGLFRSSTKAKKDVLNFLRDFAFRTQDNDLFAKTSSEETFDSAVAHYTEKTQRKVKIEEVEAK